MTSNDAETKDIEINSGAPIYDENSFNQAIGHPAQPLKAQTEHEKYECRGSHRVGSWMTPGLNSVIGTPVRTSD